MNVRSATLAMLALAIGPAFSVTPSAAAAAPGEQAVAAPATQPRVTIAMVPSGTEVEEIAAAVPGIAPGVASAGLGPVPASQTYLDIGQGSRLNGSLYPFLLPPVYVVGERVPKRVWTEVTERAREAPAEIVPGLLASSLGEAGVPINARRLVGGPALIAVDRGGAVTRGEGCEPGACPGVTVTSVRPPELPGLAARLEGDDLLIALERPPPERSLLSIGIAGGGFDGRTLSSPATRMEGYVLATDLLPTILGRYGISVPDEVSGQEIEPAGDSADASAVASREQRLTEIGPRRSPVIGINLMIWIALAAAAILLSRGRLARPALATGAVAVALLPVLLLVGAALTPSETVERLIVGLGGPLLAAGLLAALRRPLAERAPYGAFALAATVSVVGTALDMLAGSPLTALSLLGPNPGQGTRFYGIGNELEAVIGALLTLGAGAAVSAIRPADPARTVAIAASVATVIAVAIFAPGRFGADVGAAITFPAGAAGVVIAALGARGRRAALIVATPFFALLALLAVDLILGGDAHLSRSVLDAGGLDELGNVLERRLRLGAGTFPRYLDSPFFVATLVAIGVAVVFRARIATWLAGYPAAAAGVVGAAAATLIGTLANDSAALLLMVGSAYVAVFLGLAWAAGAPRHGGPPGSLNSE